jgi:hypothetical protein
MDCYCHCKENKGLGSQNYFFQKSFFGEMRAGISNLDYAKIVPTFLSLQNNKNKGSVKFVFGSKLNFDYLAMQKICKNAFFKHLKISTRALSNKVSICTS